MGPPDRTRHPLAPSSSPRTRTPTSAFAFPPETEGQRPGDTISETRARAQISAVSSSPPPENPPPPAPQPNWFETSTGDCSNTGASINGPTLFRGKDLDPKTICFQLEDGSYELREGFLGNCGGPCCIFYGEAT